LGFLSLSLSLSPSKILSLFGCLDDTGKLIDVRIFAIRFSFEQL
jgi:hypothetical protein